MRCIACGQSTRHEPYMPVYQMYKHDNTFIGDFHPDCYIESLLASGEISQKRAEELYKRNGIKEHNV